MTEPWLLSIRLLVRYLMDRTVDTRRKIPIYHHRTLSFTPILIHKGPDTIRLILPCSGCQVAMEHYKPLLPEFMHDQGNLFGGYLLEMARRIRLHHRESRISRVSFYYR